MSSETTWTCDGCGKRTQGALHELQAKGWIRMDLYTSTMRYAGGSAGAEVCSDGCLRIAVEEKLRQPWHYPPTTPPPEVPELPTEGPAR